MKGEQDRRTLSSAEVDAYWRDGFLFLRDVFTDEDVGRWRAEGDRLWSSVDVDDKNPRVQWRGHGKRGDIADRLDPILDISPEFDRLARDSRITDAAADALGGDVTILKAKLIMKRPGTMGYGLHQDYPYWEFVRVPADHILVAVIPLDSCNSESGAMEMFPGRHNERIAPAPDGSPLDTDPDKIDFSTGVFMELEPGDVALFHSLTPHRSAPNLSDHSRRALYYSYIRAEHGDLYKRYYADRPTLKDHERPQ